MKLGDGVEAAIHCTTALASLEGNATLPASALAEFHGLSPSYLLKHLKRLVADGILESVSGPAGGYRLAKPADNITLADVVLAIEGHSPAFRCSEIRQRGPAPLPTSAYPMPCGINRAMLRAEKAYRDALAATRISDLIADHEANSDPRVVARGCAFLSYAQRAQTTSRPPQSSFERKYQCNQD